MTPSTFATRKRVFRTSLIVRIPSPGEVPMPAVPDNGELVTYRSDGLDLKAIVLKPEGDQVRRDKAVVFSHGGCHLKEYYVELAQQFVQRGFYVLLPTYRGENGNGGNYELFCGEVDDAREAIRWFADRPYFDDPSFYVFGYSMGGEIAALLSLYDDLPVEFTASCGAFFPRPERFGSHSMFGCPVPFDPDDPREVSVRTLANNIDGMHIRHIAWIGLQDDRCHREVFGNFIDVNELLTIVEIEGDHDTSLEPALRAFIKYIDPER